MNTLSIRLPNSLHQAAKKLAEKENISINQFITLAISEKLSALGTEEFFEKRARRANRRHFLDVLKNAPDIEPEEDDKL